MSKSFIITRAIVRAVFYLGVMAMFLAGSWWSIMLLWAVATKP